MAVCGRDRPVIGILTQPSPPELAALGSSYIAASYVKYVESGGALAVPVFHNASASQLRAVYDQLDGVLFPGGGSDISPHTALFKAASYFVWRAVKEARTAPFVVIGHCQGFELINVIVSGNASLLTPFDAENISLPLLFTNAAPRSRLFGSAPAAVYTTLATSAVTMNSHQFGVDVSAYTAPGSKLSAFFDLLSYNTDRQGKPFVSSVEAHDPAVEVYALQWHPEKPQFEWRPAGINHSADSISANSYMQRWLVNRARRSPHQLTDEPLLIYNYQPVYTGAGIYDTFEQCYVF
jgi:gamma-glutamyl hydrolase